MSHNEAAKLYQIDALFQLFTYFVTFNLQNAPYGLLCLYEDTEKLFTHFVSHFVHHARHRGLYSAALVVDDAENRRAAAFSAAF